MLKFFMYVLNSHVAPLIESLLQARNPVKVFPLVISLLIVPRSTSENAFGTEILTMIVTLKQMSFMSYLLG